MSRLFGRKAQNEVMRFPASNVDADNNRVVLTDAQYELVAKDIMARPPPTGYLKHNLPLRFAARCEEVRWIWNDNRGRLVQQTLIGGGRNSDLDEWGDARDNNRLQIGGGPPSGGTGGAGGAAR